MAKEARASCDCGQLTFRTSARPVLQVVCHCTDCREVTGLPFTPIAFFVPGAYSVDGAAEPRTMKGSSGQEKTYFSCPQCKACVYATVGALKNCGGAVASRLKPLAFRPLFHVWTCEKAPDTRITGMALRYPRDPPRWMRAAFLRLLPAAKRS